MHSAEYHLLHEYQQSTTLQRSLHSYHHSRALYLKEILSQTTFHMASRILAVSTIKDKHTHCPAFVYNLVKDLLMNELEIATMTFYMWLSREDLMESLEVLMVICGFHAKVIMTSEIGPLKAYVLTTYPYFTPQKYDAWFKLRTGSKFEIKKLHSIYKKLTTSGTYTDLIDTAIEEFTPIPVVIVQGNRDKEAQYREEDVVKTVLPLLGLPSSTELQVNGSFLESAVSLQPFPSMASENSYNPFDIGEDLLRQRSYDGGQSSFPS